MGGNIAAKMETPECYSPFSRNFLGVHSYSVNTQGLWALGAKCAKVLDHGSHFQGSFSYKWLPSSGLDLLFSPLPLPMRP